MNWDYITKHLNAYNRLPCNTSRVHDDLLYRIGSHVDVLTPQDCQAIDKQRGWFTSEQRYRVLNWLICQDGIEIEGDLTILIFGCQQLQEWLTESDLAYPDYEFYLAFEYQDEDSSGWKSGINYTLFWMPKPGAPEPDIDNDFSWQSYWESGEMFWGEFPGGFTNQFDFNLDCYPDQGSFTNPSLTCKEGDRYTTPTEEDEDLLSVAQSLEAIAVANRSLANAGMKGAMT
jgi:hypothetical protein